MAGSGNAGKVLAGAAPRIADARRLVAQAATSVEAASHVVRDAAAGILGGGGGAELRALLREVESLSRRVEGLRARTLPRVESDGLWELDGQRSFAAWQQASAGVPYSRAMRDTKRARALRDEIPAFGRALEAGEVEVEKVDILRAAMDRSPARAGSLRADGGASLARIASTLAVREWRRVVDAWAATVDPEAEERAYRAAAGRRELFVSPTTGGYHVSGWLDVESGQVVRTVLDAVGATLEGRDEGSPTGYCPRGEVMADALVTVARTVLGGGVREGSRIKPQVTISVPYATARRVVADAARSARAQRRRGARPGGVPHGTMRTSEAPVLPGLDVVEAILGSGGDPARLTGMQPATYGDGRVVPPSVLAAHLCDGAYTRVIFGPAGEPLDVGRESRLFTRAQVKALRERDGGCQFPGCAAPVGWCDAHHTLPWSRGGRTDIDHAILLCTTHHHELHRHGWSVHRYADRWEFLGRDGELRATRPRHQRAAPQRLPVPTRT